MWKLVGTVAIAVSGWATWAANHGAPPVPAPPPAAGTCATAVEQNTVECRMRALEPRVTAIEQSALACREQSALALQEIVGVIVGGGARGNEKQREAMAAAAQRRFKRALLQGSTFEQALKEALGGDD